MGGLDLDDRKHKRQSERHSLRKKSREQMLQAKRRHMVSDETDTKEGEQPINLNIEIPRLRQYSRELASDDPSVRHNGIVKLRQIVSLTENPPFHEVVGAGSVGPSIKLLLNSDHPQLQIEAAWFLTNLASGAEIYTRAIVRAGGLEAFRKLVVDLTRHNVKLSEQCIWAISNICGDSNADYRFRLLCPEIFGFIGELMSVAHRDIEEDPSLVSMISDAAWCLSNLCRWGKKLIPKHHAKTMTQLICHGLKRYPLCPGVIENLLWGAANLCNIPIDEEDAARDPSLLRLQDLVDYGYAQILPQIVQCLDVGGEFLSPSIRIVGNFLVGDDAVVESLCQVGLIDRLKNLSHAERGPLKEVVWTMHNLVVSEVDSSELMDEKMIERLIHFACDGSRPAVQREALWCLGQLVEFEGNWQQIVMMMNKGVWKAIEQMMGENQPVELISFGLNCLQKILECGSYVQNENDLAENPFARYLEEEGCLDDLERIQISDRVGEDIYNAAVLLTTTFWQTEEPELDNFKPDVADGGKSFAFGSENITPTQFSF